MKIRRKSMLVFFKGIAVLILILFLTSVQMLVVGNSFYWWGLVATVSLTIVLSELFDAYRSKFKHFPWEEDADDFRKVLNFNERWRH